MGKLVGIATGRQVRKEVIDSRINFSITQARDWVRLHWTGGQCGTEEKRMDSRCILQAAMTGLSDGLRDVQKARKIPHTEQLGKY